MNASSRTAALLLLTGLALAAPLDAGLAIMPVPATHACAGQAADLALEHLERRSGNGDRVGIARDAIRTLNPVKAPDGKGWRDVLEVPGTIAERAFVVHLLYAQGDGTCLSKGVEVHERR